MTWKKVKLSEVCELQNGFAFKSKLFQETGKPVLRISNIQNQEVDINKIVYFNPKDYNLNMSQYEVKPNDLLIAMSGATTGKIGFNKTDSIFYLNQRVGNLKPKSSIDKYFLYYLLSTKVEENLKISKGAAQPNLSSEQIKNITFLLPPLEEQQRIVAKLDAFFAEIEKTIDAVKTQKKNMFLLINKIICSKFSSTIETKPLGDLCDFLNGYAFKSSDTIEDSETQLLRMGNLYQNRLDLKRKPVFYPNSFAKTYSRYVVENGDIVMTLTGTVGKKDYGFALKIEETSRNLLLNQRILKLHNFKSDLIQQEYLLYYLQSENFLNELYKSSHGTRQANLSSDTIAKLQIPLPSIKTQTQIVKVLNEIVDNQSVFLNFLDKKLSNLNSLKSVILEQKLYSEVA